MDFIEILGERAKENLREEGEYEGYTDIDALRLQLACEIAPEFKEFLYKMLEQAGITGLEQDKEIENAGKVARGQYFINGGGLARLRNVERDAQKLLRTLNKIE